MSVCWSLVVHWIRSKNFAGPRLHTQFVTVRAVLKTYLPLTPVCEMLVSVTSWKHARTLPDTVFRGKASPFSYTGETVEWSGLKSQEQRWKGRDLSSQCDDLHGTPGDYFFRHRFHRSVSPSSLSQQLIELDQCRSPLTALARDSSLLPLPPPSPIYYFSPCRYRVLVEMFCAGTGPYLPVKTDIIIMPV